jgi:hypothetical protein
VALMFSEGSYNRIGDLMQTFIVAQKASENPTTRIYT